MIIEKNVTNFQKVCLKNLLKSNKLCNCIIFFTKFCCKDGRKAKPILKFCKKLHSVFCTHDKKIITIFAHLLKTLKSFCTMQKFS